MMITLPVNDMPKSKEFYANQLGFKSLIDFRQDDANLYVTLAAPEGGANLTLTTRRELAQPGNVTLYFETDDVDAANEQLAKNGIKINEVMDDLFGPGSGVKWFNLHDPDGNLVFLAQKHEPKSPF